MASTCILGLLFLLGEAVNYLTGYNPSQGFCLFMKTTMVATRVAAWAMIIGSVLFAVIVLSGC
jgi:uncharacterized membrane protein